VVKMNQEKKGRKKLRPLFNPTVPDYFLLALRHSLMNALRSGPLSALVLASALQDMKSPTAKPYGL